MFHWSGRPDVRGMRRIALHQIGGDLRTVPFELSAEHFAIGRKRVEGIRARVHRHEGVPLFDPFDKTLFVRERQVAGGVGEDHAVNPLFSQTLRREWFERLLHSCIKASLRRLGLRLDFGSPFGQLLIVFLQVGFIARRSPGICAARGLLRLVRFMRDLPFGLAAKAHNRERLALVGELLQRLFGLGDRRVPEAGGHRAYNDALRFSGGEGERGGEKAGEQEAGEQGHEEGEVRDFQGCAQAKPAQRGHYRKPLLSARLREQFAMHERETLWRLLRHEHPRAGAFP